MKIISITAIAILSACSHRTPSGTSRPGEAKCFPHVKECRIRHLLVLSEANLTSGESPAELSDFDPVWVDASETAGGQIVSGHLELKRKGESRSEP